MIKFQQQVQKQLNIMAASGRLYRSSITGQQVWDKYLASFDYDPIFRDPASSEHNCNNCKNFLRRYGNIVSIAEDFSIITLFDFTIEGEFAPVAKKLSEYLQSEPIANIFRETFDELNGLPYEKCSKTNTIFQLGITKNVKMYTKEEAEKFGVVKPNEIRTFTHINMTIPALFVDKTGQSVESIMENYRSTKDVFKRGMETISLDTLKLVRDLINQGSLLDGQTHLYKIEQIIPLKEAYDRLASKEQDNWCWATSYGMPFAKFRNELIGVLCVELSEGEELNKAVMSWNKRVDPTNYMKAKAPITPKQIKEAKDYVEENGYTESFDRRFATISDIKSSEIKHMNSGDGKLKSVSIFDGVKGTNSRHKRNEFDGVEEVTIDKFMNDILPNCSSVEVLLRNIHTGNLVTLTTANNSNSKPIFKWDNNYSWTYNGNLAGKSQIKEAVKEAGGNVEGALNFRLAWNDEGQNDNSDLDAWARQPDSIEIGYSTRYRKDRGGIQSQLSGILDVDNTTPNGKLAVENITWSDKRKMRDGKYHLWVNQFNARNSKGFKAEIEFEGEVYSYNYERPLSGVCQVAIVTLKEGTFSIEHLLPETSISKPLYGLDTNEFHKVNLVCLSPNHWGPNHIGNKHYFFMIEGAKCPNSIRSFHIENLIPELLEHRKVMEVLGNTNVIESKTDAEQLSGLGFNATVRDELIVKLSGNFKRVIKIKF